jgi:hypothetical protein
LAIYGTAVDGPTSTSAILGYGLTAISGTAGFIVALNASKNYQKSVDTYNKFAGY